jgi:hypothetical protein
MIEQTIAHRVRASSERDPLAWSIPIPYDVDACIDVVGAAPPRGPAQLAVGPDGVTSMARYLS